MRATLRWAHSDLRTHRGEALFLVLATAGIVASLLLATALFGYATNPWQRVFTQSHGAHVWLHTDTAADTGKLAALDGVDSVAGPYPTASTTVSSRGSRAAVELRGTPERPSVGRPPLVSGHWLDPATPNGVVLESRLARALLAEPGDTLTVPGTARELTVVGLADSAEPRYRPGEQPGLVWALPSAVPDPGGQVIGLRLTDPGDTSYIVQRAVTVLGAGAIGEVSTWQQARAEAQGDNRLLGQVLGLFGLGALVAAGLAVHGAIGTRIRGHLRDLSVLKAIGFTPGQVVRIFLLQHLAYALLGAVVAAALAEALGSRIPGRLGDAVGVWQGLPGHTVALFVIPVGAVLFIGATTGLAAWRAGRVPPVPVQRPATTLGGRPTGTTGRALGPQPTEGTPDGRPAGTTDPAPGPLPAEALSGGRPTGATSRALGPQPTEGTPGGRLIGTSGRLIGTTGQPSGPQATEAAPDGRPTGATGGALGPQTAAGAPGGWVAGGLRRVLGLRPAAPRTGQLSDLARRALGARVPPALVLGWHKAFTRRPRSLATVARLTLPLLLIVVAMSAWTTIDRFHSTPEQIGLPTALSVRADTGLNERQARALLERDPQVAAAYPGVETAALVPGQTATIALRGLGTDRDPYPYTLAEGRPARGADEAVAGQGLLDLLDVRVGDWVRMTVGDQPQILHIVGRSIEPENAGRIISTSLDTLRANDPRLRPTLYELRLEPGADPGEVADRLATAGRGHLDVHTVTNPADGLSPLRAVVAGLIAVLALIGLIELLTAIGGTVREGERDLLALKAIGLSPRQITAITVTATGCTALAAVLAATALGLPLAHWLIDAQGRSSGIGAGIAQGPSAPLMLLLGAAAVLCAAALAAVPAARAARRRLADTLSAVA
ncbi:MULTISPECIES: ABC transporter permease [Streptomyces]|uniref:Acidobacterial duplicated orphan permease n=1 Tax=Streptomyces chartreusis NRRL 3882 TaxID=1079985 RepID=A0A2N9BH03_STRCX|nr:MULTISPECIES: FtsX-like permease family protein [Streptomyces]MYS88277.1 FtsX-like permease family protein [Streptomyces sp. SID5464]SOR82650.1 acidobacterial duplicated orphan permease [Streptomyces chartreusis NRRL 3882]